MSAATGERDRARRREAPAVRSRASAAPRSVELGRAPPAAGRASSRASASAWPSTATGCAAITASPPDQTSAGRDTPTRPMATTRTGAARATRPDDPNHGRTVRAPRPSSDVSNLRRDVLRRLHPAAAAAPTGGSAGCLELLGAHRTGHVGPPAAPSVRPSSPSRSAESAPSRVLVGLRPTPGLLRQEHHQQRPARWMRLRTVPTGIPRARRSPGRAGPPRRRARRRRGSRRAAPASASWTCRAGRRGRPPRRPPRRRGPGRASSGSCSTGRRWRRRTSSRKAFVVMRLNQPSIDPGSIGRQAPANPEQHLLHQVLSVGVVPRQPVRHRVEEPPVVDGRPPPRWEPFARWADAGLERHATVPAGFPAGQVEEPVLRCLPCRRLRRRLLGALLELALGLAERAGELRQLGAAEDEQDDAEDDDEFGCPIRAR